MTILKLNIRQFMENRCNFRVEIDENATILNLKEECFKFISNNRNMNDFAFVSLLSEINLSTSNDIILSDEKKICEYNNLNLENKPIYMLIKINLHKSEE